jgi:hypothetical protein
VELIARLLHDRSPRLAFAELVYNERHDGFGFLWFEFVKPTAPPDNWFTVTWHRIAFVE